MKKALKKATAVILASVMCLCAGGCSKKTENELISFKEGEYVSDKNLNAPGEFPICKEKITLKVGIPKDAKISDFDNNSYTKFLEEKTNIDIEFVYFPATSLEARQKLDLMISGGGKDLPDVLIGFDVQNTNLYKYGKSNYIYDLSYLYDNCSYYMKDMLEAYPDLMNNFLKCADGKIYSIPRVSVNHYAAHSGYLWIYKPWLDKLGLKAPETIEEFKEVLIAFRDKDPNGNGLKDEIPFLGATDDMAGRYINFLGTPFLPVNVNNYYFYADENNKVHASYMQDEWKDMLKYLNELCEEGLFSPSTFTTTQEQFNQIARNSETLIGSMTVAPYIFDSTDKRRDEYVVIGPLAGYDGTRRVMLGNEDYSCVSGAFIITKNCKHPEAAFRLGDFMCSNEATMTAKYGAKGVDWTTPDEGSKTTYDSLGIKPTFKKLNTDEVHNRNWGTYVWAGYATQDMNLGAQNDNSLSKWNLQEINNYDKYYQYGYRPIFNISRLLYDEEDIERVDELKYETSEYVNDMYAKFILGREDIDEKWDEYKNNLKKLGVDELTEIFQKAYNNSLGK